jgi:hypothetical protein
MQSNKHTKIGHRVNQAIHTKGSVCLRLRSCCAADACHVIKYLQNISLVIVLLLALRNIHLILLHFENRCGDLIVGVAILITMHPEFRNNLLGFWRLSFLKHCQSFLFSAIAHATSMCKWNINLWNSLTSSACYVWWSVGISLWFSLGGFDSWHYFWSDVKLTI